MKRGYDSQNRYGFRGGNNDPSSGSYRNSGNSFAGHSSNGASGSRSSGGHSSNNSQFDQQQNQFQPHQSHAQTLPSLMSTTVPPPFSPLIPNQQQQQQQYHQLQLQQHQNLQQLIVRQQQQLPLKNEEVLILNQYYSLLGSGYQEPSGPKYLALGQLPQSQQPPPQWPGSHNFPSTSGDYNYGYDQQQGFPGQPPLPPLPPQQPPPPAPAEPPPPPNDQQGSTFSSFSFNSPNSDRNPFNNNQRNNQGGQQESGGQGRRRNRNRNKAANKNNPNHNPNQQSRQNQWKNDTNSPSAYGSQSDLSRMFRSKPPESPSSLSSSFQSWSNDSASNKKGTNGNTDDEDEVITDASGSQTIINKRAKHQPMSAQNNCKEWNAVDAAKALEMEHAVVAHKLPTLILKFPDPDLSKDIVKGYSSFIDHVHFQQPSTARYCFIQLKNGADVPKLKDQLSQIPFGTGKITAEYKNATNLTNEAAIEDIDPYTIYIGNLPTNVSVQRVKAYFPNAARIDIGFAQRMKYTRYAFVRYATVDEAFAGFYLAFKMDLGPRSLVIRFRRTRGNIGLNTNDPDGKNQSKRKRKAMLDAEAIACEGGAPDISTDCDLNSFADDQHAEIPFSEDSNEYSNDRNDDDDDDDYSLSIVESETSTGTILPIQIKTEEESKITSSDETEEDISQHIVHKKPTPAAVLPIKIKVEVPESCQDNPSQSLAFDASKSIQLTALNTEIKKELTDDVSDNAFFDAIPPGDDESGSAFGDEEFMRQNNITMDEIPDNPLWQQELIDQKEIKKEIEIDKDRHVIRNVPGSTKPTAMPKVDDGMDALYDQLNPDGFTL